MSSGDTKDLMRLRLAQAREALDDAQFLLDNQRSIRSVINRTYYGMFYAALALLQTGAHEPKKHTGVIGLFDRDFVLTDLFEKRLSESFHRAFDLRQATDYRTVALPTLAETQALLQQAWAFVQAVRDYLARQGLV